MLRLARRIEGKYAVVCATTRRVLGTYDTEVEQWYHVVTGYPPRNLAAAKRLHRGGTMKDFTGRVIQVGDTLAISPSRSGYLYRATVEAIEETTRNSWSGQHQAMVAQPFFILTLRLASNGRLQKLDSNNLYQRTVIIPEGE